GGLIWWISRLGLVAVAPLVLSQAAYSALFGWVMVRWVPQGSIRWVGAAGLWALTEFVRYRFPVGGFEWGAWGYALSDVGAARAAARWIGTSGLTVLSMGAAAGLATLRTRAAVPAVGVLGLALAVGAALPPLPGGPPVPVAVVQGSTPCPFEHCPNERFQTYRQHLDLTRDIEAGSVDLVVWSEGSTGSFDADPVNAPEVGEAIGAEAERIGAWMVVGGDRPVSETRWINANVVFSPDGEIVGEYRKQHPVPFGEYIPARPLFEWVPALDQVPRDMIPGEGPHVFALEGYDLGTVISFEGNFSRYPRRTARAGADLLVVATNEGSYGLTPAADQFIGMTRMRSAETGLDVVHAAVTGKSVVITDGGKLGEITGLGTREILYGEVQARSDVQTVYVRYGDWVLLLMLAAGGFVLVRELPPSGNSGPGNGSRRSATR
ncbi:MAG: apolipoprotein N-acyltransferase, partial [Actinomycetota bacterium]